LIAVAAFCFSATTALAGDPTTTVYITRHLDDQNKLALIDASTGTYQEVGTPKRTCIEQVLNPLGVERAKRLAAWFDQKNISPELSNVVATFKPRTAASVALIASNAGLPVVQVPAEKTRECDPAHDIKGDLYNDATSSLGPEVEAIPAFAPGTINLVAAHSTTIYQIFNALGITVDPTNTAVFPVDLPAGATTCDPASLDKTNTNLNARGCKVLGFNNLWKIKIDKNGVASVDFHWVLDMETEVTAKAAGNQ